MTLPKEPFPKEIQSGVALGHQGNRIKTPISQQPDGERSRVSQHATELRRRNDSIEAQFDNLLRQIEEKEQRVKEQERKALEDLNRKYKALDAREDAADRVLEEKQCEADSSGTQKASDPVPSSTQDYGPTPSWTEKDVEIVDHSMWQGSKH